MANVDWSKVGRRSKRIGKDYERKVASLLSECSGVNFRRVPGSGGHSKQGLAVRQELFCGDIISDRADFRFCIEAKNREVFSFESILKNPSTAPFTAWWYQCIEDAKRVNLSPMMFFKPDSRDNFVAVDEATYRAITMDGHSPVNHFVLQCYHKPLKFKAKIDHKMIEVESQLPLPFIFNWKDIVQLPNLQSLLFKGQ